MRLGGTSSAGWSALAERVFGQDWTTWRNPTRGRYVFTVNLFYTGQRVRPVISVEARSGTLTTSTTVTVPEFSYNFGLPQFRFGREPFELIDPLGAVPFIAAGLGAALVTGGASFIVSGGAQIIGFSPQISATTIGIFTTGAAGNVAVSTVIAWGSGWTSFIGITSTGLTAMFGAAGVTSGAVIGIRRQLQGGIQRNLNVYCEIVRATRYRVRLGWRLLGGFSDTVTGWRSGTVSGRNKQTFTRVLGGEGGIAIEWQAEGPDGAGGSTIGFRFATAPIESTAPGTPAPNAANLRVQAIGASRVSYRYGTIATGRQATFTPDVGATWRFVTTTKSGRIGTGTIPLKTGRAPTAGTQYRFHSPSLVSEAHQVSRIRSGSPRSGRLNRSGSETEPNRATPSTVWPLRLPLDSNSAFTTQHPGERLLVTT